MYINKNSNNLAAETLFKLATDGTTKGGLKAFDEFYTKLGFQSDFRLATRPDTRAGTDQMWDKAEKELKEALSKKGIKAGDKLVLKFDPGLRQFLLKLTSFATLILLVAYIYLGKKIYSSLTLLTQLFRVRFDKIALKTREAIEKE